jgi:hypothetical protein
MSTNYEAPHRATYSVLLLLYPSIVHIVSLEPCSQTPQVYALPSQFYVRTKQLVELWFYII